MRAVVVYESMFGNTHEIAEHIAQGLRVHYDASVVAVADMTPDLLAHADLLVVGGPTHAHGLSNSATRSSAAEIAGQDEDVHLEPDALRRGLRNWFDEVEHGSERSAAAFDTRIDGVAALTGRASKGIARRLRRHHFDVIVAPESFLVDRRNHLLPGEAQRAFGWARQLANQAAALPH